MRFRPALSGVYGACGVMLLLAGSPALADPPGGFDARVERLRRATGVPGMAVAIVENGKIMLAKGYGVKRLGRSDPVTPATIFPNGSTGKAFTTAALALLVDRGRIGWDDRVINHLSGFQMYDPYVTREMTVRDLLVHRSGLGLGAGDMLFVPSTNRTRADSVRALRHIKPATSFRSGYAYDNILYMVAGQLIESVTGKTWERFVVQELLRPAGLRDSTTDLEARLAAPDRAEPHARADGPVRGVGPQRALDARRTALGATANPAGGLAVSARDMARWLQVQLGRGALPGGGRLWSEAQAAEMWKPVVLQPVTPLPAPLKAAQPLFDTYALGWDVQDYKGARVVGHGGAVFGFLSTVVMLPDRGIGFALLINSEDGELLRGLTNELLDHYLGAPTQDWPAAWAAYKRDRLAAAEKAVARASAARVRSSQSLPLARYAGTYADPWYGPIRISARGGSALHIDFLQSPGLSGPLEHWQHDTFRTRWSERSFENAYVTFALNPEGRVARIAMRAVSPTADFSYDYQDLDFTPVAEPPTGGR